ncbi:MAG TPA: hypothetical protein VG015_05615, partial [Candidatus Dormibacteraeota bacterium]|nr:hypothetical protein [Candidatus Dormibacteraeota bacterium]
KQYDLISTIDAVCEIAAIRGITPNSYEVAWSGIDPDDLHVQLLARHVGADYVVSANTRHFPNPVGVDGKNRGELSGVIWITPDQVF